MLTIGKCCVMECRFVRQIEDENSKGRSHFFVIKDGTARGYWCRGSAATSMQWLTSFLTIHALWVMGISFHIGGMKFNKCCLLVTFILQEVVKFVLKYVLVNFPKTPRCLFLCVWPRPRRLYFFRPKISPGSRKVLFQPIPAQNIFV